MIYSCIMAVLNHSFVFLYLITLCVCARTVDKCEQGKNCKLPNCFCSTFIHPSINKTEIPQMVYFGFDDALTPVVDPFYKKLFTTKRVNPNGCPISMTLFVSHQYTSYAEVKYFYDKGMEIASHSVHHQDIKAEKILLEEAGQQKRNLQNLAGIPSTDIVGWRSPNLLTAGDYQPDVLMKLGYKYDVSLTYKRSSVKDVYPWPFTADFGWPFRCQMEPCLHKHHPGFWEFPVSSFVDYKNQYPCNYVDGCLNRPENEDESFQYLMNNFNTAYYGNRAPFGINMHAAWFVTKYNFKAMDKFIKEILKRPDVYIVSIKQVLNWMQEPIPLSKIKYFKPWQCDSSSQIMQKTTKAVKTTQKITTEKPTTKTKQPTTTITTKRPTTTSPKKTTVVTVKPTTTKSTTKTLPTTSTEKSSTTTVKVTASSTTEKQTTTNVHTTQTTKSISTSFPQLLTTEAVRVHQGMLKTTNVPDSGTILSWNNPESSTINPASSSASSINFNWARLWNGLINNAQPKPLQPVKTVRKGSCVQEFNCRLPNCFCESSSTPNNLDRPLTPQFVYISIDGNINYRAFFKYRKIFAGERKNPNGCPISSTFFVSDGGSRQEHISYLHNKGQEIAMRSSSSRSYTNVLDLNKKIENQRDKMSEKGVHIHGWRSSELKPLGDDQFSALYKQGIEYDSTLVLQDTNGGKQWPFTLDFGWRHTCVIPDCPKQKYSGLWEIPNVPIMDYKNMYPCNYADGCMFSPRTADETFHFLWNNFAEYYQSNKAPFGINFRPVWFTHSAYRENLKGFEMFLDKVTQLNDVYIVSYSKLIKWIKNPQPLSAMKQNCL